MSKLETRKTKLTFQTASTVRSGRRHRPIVIEAETTFALVRLAGTHTRFTVPYDAIYDLGCKLEARRVRAEKLAAKKVAR